MNANRKGRLASPLTTHARTLLACRRADVLRSSERERAGATRAAPFAAGTADKERVTLCHLVRIDRRRSGHKRTSAIQTVGTVPPSITYSVPVIEAARGETRKAMRSATSIGLAGRPSGMPPSPFMMIRFALVVGTRLGREALRQCNRRLGFDPAGRNADDANSLRSDLLRQCLTIG